MPWSPNYCSSMTTASTVKKQRNGPSTDVSTRQGEVTMRWDHYSLSSGGGGRHQLSFNSLQCSRPCWIWSNAPCESYPDRQIFDKKILPPPRRRLCDQASLSVICSVCEQDYCKSNQLISLKLGLMIRPTNRKNRWWSGPRYALRITFPLPTPLISHSHRLILTTLSDKTDSNNVMNQQHFGSDPAVPDSNSGSFFVKIFALPEVCALWALSEVR